MCTNMHALFLIIPLILFLFEHNQGDTWEKGWESNPQEPSDMALLDLRYVYVSWN